MPLRETSDRVNILQQQVLEDRFEIERGEFLIIGKCFFIHHNSGSTYYQDDNHFKNKLEMRNKFQIKGCAEATEESSTENTRQ